MKPTPRLDSGNQRADLAKSALIPSSARDGGIRQVRIRLQSRRGAGSIAKTIQPHESELIRLHESLPANITTLVIGHAKSAYLDALKNIGALRTIFPPIFYQLSNHSANPRTNEMMKAFMTRNIDNRGRLVRGISALTLLVGAGFGFSVSRWLGGVLLASAVFVAFEALRGWCALRACGIKTKL